MFQTGKPAIRPRRAGMLVRGLAAAAFSGLLAALTPAAAAPPSGAAHGGDGAHGAGGFHGGHMAGGGFHGGGFHGGHMAGGGFHGGGFQGHGFTQRRGSGWSRPGWGGGFYPGFGLGLAFGLGSPWGWDYAPPAYDEYNGYANPYPATQYYCYNPPGYYPYVTQCYSGWQPVG